MRGARKRVRTRAQIMDAAVRLMARDGAEAVSANEIAKAADIANGTFYLYFRDRDDVVTTVALEIAGDVARQLDQEMEGLTDAVSRNAWATRRFLDIGVQNAEWGWTLSRVMRSVPRLQHNASQYLRRDLELGVRQGVFVGPVDDFLLNAFLSMSAMALVARLSGEAGVDAGSRIAELQLRMLGVPVALAHEVAWRPLDRPAGSHL